jgi:ATP sulfurylase
MQENNQVNYKKWQKVIESMTYTFKEDVGVINEYEENFNNVFKMIDNKHPILFRLYSRGKLSIETMVILDDLVNYSDKWKQYNDIIMDEFVTMMMKYRPFLINRVNIDKSKYKKIVLNAFG